MSLSFKVLDNFVVFEGIDGSGTTTQLNKICDFLSKNGKTFYKTSEPTDGIIGKFIRQSILSNSSCKVDRESILYLYIADRIDHLKCSGGILESCKDKDFVIQDRYIFSTVAYQGVDLGYDRVFDLNKSFPFPKTIFYFDCSVKECMRRIRNRGEEIQLFEKEDFLHKVREGYENCFANLPSEVNLCKIDASDSIDNIFKIISDTLKKQF